MSPCLCVCPSLFLTLSTLELAKRFSSNALHSPFHHHLLLPREEAVLTNLVLYIRFLWRNFCRTLTHFLWDTHISLLFAIREAFRFICVLHLVSKYQDQASVFRRLMLVSFREGSFSFFFDVAFMCLHLLESVSSSSSCQSKLLFEKIVTKDLYFRLHPSFYHYALYLETMFGTAFTSSSDVFRSQINAFKRKLKVIILMTMLLRLLLLSSFPSAFPFFFIVCSPCSCLLRLHIIESETQIFSSRHSSLVFVRKQDLEMPRRQKLQ